MRIRPGDYAIHNAMEDLADQAIERVLSEDRGACDCSMCRDDVKAQMLNRVQHRYYPILVGEAKRPAEDLEKLDTDLFNQVMLECYKALQIVKLSPRHDHARARLTNTSEGLLAVGVSEILSSQKLFLDRDSLSQLMAEALNGLEPSYTTTHIGDAFSRVAEMDPAYIARVYSEIFKALETLGMGERCTS